MATSTCTSTSYLIPTMFSLSGPVGDSMVGAGIHDGDLLIADRSKKKPNGKVVIASLNGEFTLKRLVQTQECFELQPENPDYPSIPVSVDDDFQIWGVVRHVIHKL